MVSVKNICKVYRDGENYVRVLDNVNLLVNTAEFISIRGASGAGKSTFLNMLGALDSPDSGEIEVENTRLSDYKKQSRLHDYRREKVGFIFQNHYLMPDFTVLENVMMPLLMNKVPKAQAQEQAKAILERTGLSHRLTHFPSQISGGESQRVAVARAVVKKPPLVLADEPTGNLDSQNKAKFIELLSKLQSQDNLTVVVVTHEPDLANSAHAKYIMVDGCLSKL